MAHRVQLSLQIVDDTLYNDYIEELKVNRELNTKIIDVLSAYYYNADIRDAIDKYTNGDSIQEEYDTSTDISGLFADIKNAMAVSNFYAEEAMQTLEDGTDTIDDILHQTTKQAQEDGFYENVNESEYGYETPKLLTTVNEQNVQKVAKKVKETSHSSGNEEFLERLVLKLCDMVGLDPNSVEQDNTRVETTEQEPVTEEMRESVEEVREPVEQPVKPVEPVKEVVEQPIKPVKPVETETEEEQGYDALMESLNSLVF